MTARGDALDLIVPDIETDFTKWLFWMIAPPEANPEIQRCVLGALWPGWNSISEFEVKREHQVAEGHAGQTGRLDLLVESRQAKKVLAVEIKTKDPGEGELGKHSGYERSIAAAYKTWASTFVLLVPDPAVVSVEGTAFRAISWSAITRALRALLLAKTLEPRDAALVALFVGAVEARVLGFPVRAWRRALGRAEPAAGLARAICASPYLDYLEEAYGV